MGSYCDPAVGGANGKSLTKNVMDDYRYIVQNYEPGNELFLFGFSRGVHTVRSLCGLSNHRGILKRPDAQIIEVLIHKSVKQRWDADPKDRPPKVKDYVDQHGWPARLVT